MSAELGVCAYPNTLTLEHLLEFTEALDIKAVVLYANQLSYAPALKEHGYTVGAFLPWRRDTGRSLEGVDYVFIGDEVNIKTHVHDPTPAEEYVLLAEATVRTLRERFTGDIVCASLGCIPSRWGFGKWFARPDVAYLERLRDLGAKHIFDAFACNPFQTPFGVVERDYRSVMGDTVKIYCAGWGYENTTIDGKLLTWLGAWGWRKRQLKRSRNIVVASIWCLGTYTNGQWGLIELRPRLSHTGRRLARRPLFKMV